jgi:hypothetical protein
MTIYNKTLTVSEITNLNLTINCVAHFEFKWDAINGEVHYLVINDDKKIGFSDSKYMRSSRRKMQNMKLAWGEIKQSTISDLAAGLNEAIRRGENPFAGSLLVG